MRLLTNPGSNLHPDVVTRYGIELLPQRIIVDGVVHDTRENMPQSMVDAWVRDARRWPETVGTTAAETVGAFERAARAGEREILVVCTSRKIINSYQSAEAARRTFLDSPLGAGMRIELHDTGVTDVGAGLHCLYAAEAARAGRSLAEIMTALTSLAAATRLAFGIATLENMVKGRRASFLRSWLANMLGVRPIIGFVDGEAQLIDKYAQRADLVANLVAHFSASIGAGRRVWLGVMHSEDTAVAERFEQEIRARFDVAYVYRRATAPGVYLHAGPGSFGAAMCAVDRLPWEPPIPSA